MVIESVDNKKIKEIRKLNQKKYRDLVDEFIIEGEHLVKEAEKKGLLKEVILEDGYEYKTDIEKIYVTNKVIKSISNLVTPYKVMGICKKNKEREINGNVLILDGIQDPGNLGTIIRSAVAFNIDTIILSDSAVDLYNYKVLRSAQGLNFHINIIKRDLKEEITKLKENNYKIYTTDVNGGKNIKNVKVEEKYAIIMGNEGVGVRKDISALSDEKLYINMNNNCESLNVAVATSIILYEFSK